jgi:uncharacterized protein
MEIIQILAKTLFDILARSGEMLIGLGPYVIIGTIAGEIIKYTSWTKIAYKLLSKSPLLSIACAVLVGVASPLCTYGTVPVVSELFRAGIQPAPLLAFLATSALMNPQLFIITWGGLGPEIALIRLGAVILFGLAFGLIVHRIPQQWLVNKNIANREAAKEEILNRQQKPFTFKAFAKSAGNSLAFFGFYVVIGILLGAIVEVSVPTNWIALVFKPGEWFSVLLASLAGIPLYACGGGVIPVLKTLIAAGMSKGAALGFMLVGPATRITPLMSLGSIMKPILILIYVVFLILFACCIGIIYG